MLDIKITQGAYWKGAQIPYWIYMTLVIFPLTGAIGLDHMVLRSPITAILKALTLIPLFGFWYFYDIAQVVGERELVEKFGISVPVYGPIGIGAGMFSGTAGIQESPKDIPRPWTYAAYTLTTLLFLAFPINKFVVGDYMGGLAQIIMYILFPLTFLAIIWGFYDAYRVLFDTKGIFEKGVARFFPASWLLHPYFRREAMGPLGAEPHEDIKKQQSWFGRFFEAAVEVPITSLKVVTGVTKAVEGATIGVANVVIDEAKDKVKEASSVASEAIKSADVATKAVTHTVEEGAKAGEGIASLVAKVPAIGEKVASEMADPSKLIEQAKKGAAVGGGMLIASDGPSVSTSVLIFSVCLIGFSGYVFYSLRNLQTKNTEKSDDPPDKSGIIRGTSES